MDAAVRAASNFHTEEALRDMGNIVRHVSETYHRTADSCLREIAVDGVGRAIAAGALAGHISAGTGHMNKTHPGSLSALLPYCLSVFEGVPDLFADLLRIALGPSSLTARSAPTSK